MTEVNYNSCCYTWTKVLSKVDLGPGVNLCGPVQVGHQERVERGRLGG